MACCSPVPMPPPRLGSCPNTSIMASVSPHGTHSLGTRATACMLLTLSNKSSAHDGRSNQDLCAGYRHRYHAWMTSSEALRSLQMDTVSARAIVRVRKLTVPKDVLSAGELNSKTTSRPNSSPSGSSLAARLLQQKARIAKVNEAEAASKSADDLTCALQCSETLHDDVADEGLPQFATESRSVSPTLLGSQHVEDDTRHKTQAQPTKLVRRSKHKHYTQPAQHTQQQQTTFAVQEVDQITTQVQQVRTASGPNPRTVVSDEGVGASTGAAGALAALGTSEMATVQAVRLIQPKKRGRPSLKDRKAVADKVSDVIEQKIPGSSVAGWHAQPQQQSQLFTLPAPAETMQKQRRKPGRPPKAATAGMNPLLAQQQQLYDSTVRSGSAGDGHRLSLDEPYRGSGWPAAPSSQMMGNYQQYPQQTTVTNAWPEAASLSAAGHGTSSMRTRLSIRSVAYLEDLLQQTAQAAATEGRAGSNSDPQNASKPVSKETTVQANPAGPGRLSVRSIIVSPPLSRCTSLHPAATTSPPNESAPAPIHPGKPPSAGHAASLTQPGSQAVAARSSLKPGDSQPAAAATASDDPGPAEPPTSHQHQQRNIVVPQVAVTVSKAVSSHQQADLDNILPSGPAPASDAPAVSKYTPAAFAAWHQAAVADYTQPHDVEDGSSSGDESDVHRVSICTDTAVDAHPRGDAAVASHGCARRPSLDSDTTPSPSSDPSVYNPSLLGAFSRSNASCLHMAQGLLHGGLLQGYGAGLGPPLQALAPAATSAGAVGYGSLANPRKSDRQLGLETVQRIDAIFQHSKSLQGGHFTSGVQGDPTTAPAAPQAQNAGTITSAGTAVADRRETFGDDRCSVAALCRGLRFDGDITLKEVAMAFQLRDAYDWDEDLEAAGKECKAIEDPRLKGPKLLSSSPSLSNSSVCPDPEPVPGFLPRSKWMAGNGREGASPVVPIQMGLAFQHSQEFHPGAVAVGLAPALLQRLHDQSFEVNSLLGSVNSSRRASLASSPVDVPGHMVGHQVPQQQRGPPAPAVLHAAISAAARQQQRVRGWAALMPGMDVQSDPQLAAQQQMDSQAMQPYPYMPVKMTGRGGARGRKRKHTDDSDDDYDPRKPSHQHEVYQRKTVERRAQQQYYQQRLNNSLSRYDYNYQAMQQAYSAATMQHAYVVQAASRSGAPLSMQQVQQLQQLQCMQQHAQMAMAAMEEQAAAAAAVAGSNFGADNIGEVAAPPAPSTGVNAIAASRVQPSTDAVMQPPANSLQCAGQQQQGVALRQQYQQCARPSQIAACFEHQPQGSDPVQEDDANLQPAFQAQRQGPHTQQQVRRPSYVKRRLTADDAADWLQSQAQNSLQICRQPGFSRLSSHTTSMLTAEEQDQGLRIVSPTAVQLPSGSAGCIDQLFAAAPSVTDRPVGTNSNRMRRRTLVGLQYDAIYGASAEAVAKNNSEEVIDQGHDMSDADNGQSTSLRGGRRGAYGGRARGRGGRGRGRGAAGGSAAGLSKSATNQPVGAAMTQIMPDAEPTANSNESLTVSDGPSAQHGLPIGARGRGRGGAAGRGRSGAGRGRSCLGPAATTAQLQQAQPGTASADERQQLQPAEGSKHPATASNANIGLETSQGATASVDTTSAAGLAVRQSFEGTTVAGRGRGRGRGRGVASNPSADPAKISNLKLGSVADAGPKRGALAAGRRGRGSGRGRGRIGRPRLSNSSDGQPVSCNPAPGSSAGTLQGDFQWKGQKLDAGLVQPAAVACVSNTYISGMPKGSADDSMLPPLSTRSSIPVGLHQGELLPSAAVAAAMCDTQQPQQLQQRDATPTGQQEHQYQHSEKVHQGAGAVLTHTSIDDSKQAHGMQGPAGAMTDMMIDLMAIESPL